MVLTPTYYLADFQTGDLYGEALPLEQVRLTSSLQPGFFDADLDMRKLGPLGDGYRVMDLLRNGKCTLVPILEGVTGGAQPLTSRSLGEWWVSVITDEPPSPIVRLSGPEFAGYTKEVLLTGEWVGSQRDPIQHVRALLRELFSASQTVAADLGTWESPARVPIDLRKSRMTYWDAITDLQASEDVPFEWMLRTGLVLDGWSPQRVTRTLDIGQPRLARARPDIALELAAPGSVASLTAVGREQSQHRDATTVYGWGAGHGDDQYGGPGVFTSRSREPGEPVKTRMITDSGANSNAEVRRRTRAALERATPELQVWSARMPTDRYTPEVGEVYGFWMDDQWTRPRVESGSVRCVGWSWASGSEEYELQLTEV